VLFGKDGILDLEGDRGRLTDRSGSAVEIPTSDPPDDSYHAGWFGGVAAEFEAAIAEGGGTIAQLNLSEAKAALGVILAARRSDREGGKPVRIPSVRA
jgi:hypothetical protein